MAIFNVGDVVRRVNPINCWQHNVAGLKSDWLDDTGKGGWSGHDMELVVSEVNMNLGKSYIIIGNYSQAFVWNPECFELVSSLVTPPHLDYWI